MSHHPPEAMHMERLDLSSIVLPYSLPLLPAGGGAGGAAPLAKPPAASTALKTSSLSRMEDLQQYLRRCEDQNYLKHYIKVLSSMPRDLLEDLARQIKARSAWLSAEEQREYKRAKLLNVMGAPCSPVPHRHGGLGGLGGHGGASPVGGLGSPGAVARARADADKFCCEVLGGGPAGSGESEGAGLERLAMPPAAAPQQAQQQAQQYATPADARRTKMRVLPPPAVQLLGSGGQAAAESPASDASPAELPAAGLTDHRISPDGQPPAAAAGAAPQQPLHGGGGRARQATLLPAKP